MTEAGAASVELELEPEQRYAVMAAVGIDKRAVAGTSTWFAAASLAAEAADRGYAPAFGAPIRIELSDGQRRGLLAAGIVDVTAILFDGDELRPSYREPWSAQGEEIQLSDRVRVVHVPSLSNAESRADELPRRDPGVVRLRGAEGPGPWGTGKHATTQATAEILDRTMQPGFRVADVGTGSGILALAAMDLGAASVEGFEIDAEAVAIAQDNVRLNQQDASVVVHARALDSGDGPFDLVIANLLAGLLLENVEILTGAVLPGGHLLVSGFSTARVPDIQAAFTTRGLTESHIVWRGDWAALGFVSSEQLP